MQEQYFPFFPNVAGMPKGRLAPGRSRSSTSRKGDRCRGIVPVFPAGHGRTARPGFQVRQKECVSLLFPAVVSIVVVNRYRVAVFTTSQARNASASTWAIFKGWGTRPTTAKIRGRVWAARNGRAVRHRRHQGYPAIDLQALRSHHGVGPWWRAPARNRQGQAESPVQAMAKLTVGASPQAVRKRSVAP